MEHAWEVERKTRRHHSGAAEKTGRFRAIWERTAFTDGPGHYDAVIDVFIDL